MPALIVLGEGRLLADEPTENLMDDPGLLKRAGLEPAAPRPGSGCGESFMLKTLNPLSKLFVCIVWLGAAVLIFDARFQVASIVVAVLH